VTIAQYVNQKRISQKTCDFFSKTTLLYEIRDKENTQFTLNFNESNKNVYYSAKYTANEWDKKLSYRRDSAGRRLLHRARSFKVTDFRTNRKPVVYATSY